MAATDILIVEDMLDLSRSYAESLEDLDVMVHFARDLAEAREKLASVQPAIAVLDLNLPDGKGTDLIQEINDAGYDCAPIVITAFVSITTAIDCLKAGAHDFIIKPFKTEKLVGSVQSALSARVSGARPVEGAALAPSSSRTGDRIKAVQAKPQNDFIGTSPAMDQVFASINAVAPTGASVFITGETGTGKELCAHALHQASDRAGKEIVVLNCAAIPKELFESELFGHMKGSFTGAISTKEGAAHRANGGTLFLDELGEMELSCQKKLLRFLQTGTFNRVGSTKLEKVDVRFVAATNVDPLLEIRRGTLRADLYHRLSVVPIEMPPLRQRGQDVLAIAQSFITQYSTVDGTRDLVLREDAKQALADYAWPGNVRQLQNVVRRVLIFCTGGEIAAKDVIPHLSDDGGGHQTSASHHYDRPHGFGGPREEQHRGPGFGAPQSGYAQSNSRDGGSRASGSLSDHHHPYFSQSGSSQSGGYERITLDGAQAFASAEPASSHDQEITPDLFSQTIVPVAQLERMAIDGALRKFDGDVVCAAAALKISISSVYRKRTPVKRL